MKSVLIIDDSDEFRSTLSFILLDHDYDVWEATCPDEAYKLLKEEQFDLILCDVHMPFTFNEHFHEYPYSFEVGIKTIQELGWVFPDKPIIAMSAAAPSDLERIKKELGDLPLLSKPFPPQELLAVVEESLGLQCSPLMH
jgi:CheY-like chemotaxis protein